MRCILELQIEGDYEPENEKDIRACMDALEKISYYTISINEFKLLENEEEK